MQMARNVAACLHPLWVQDVKKRFTERQAEVIGFIKEIVILSMKTYTSPSPIEILSEFLCRRAWDAVPSFLGCSVHNTQSRLLKNRIRSQILIK